MNLSDIIELNSPYKINDTTFAQLFKGKDKNQAKNNSEKKKNVIIYLPEPEAQTGIDFINTYRKKGVFSNRVLLFQIYTFFNRKFNAQEYIKEFRQKNPSIQPTVSFKKGSPADANKVDVIDLTMLSHLWYSLAGTQSKFKLIDELLNYISKLLKENDISLETHNIYLFYNGNEKSSNYIATLLYKLFRKNGMKYPVDKFPVTSWIGYFPFIEKDKKMATIFSITKRDPRDETKHVLKIGVYNMYEKEVLNASIEELQQLQDEISPLGSEKEHKENQSERSKERLKEKITQVVEAQKNDKKDKELSKITGKDNINSTEKESLDDIYKYINNITNSDEFKEIQKEKGTLDFKETLREIYKDDKSFNKVLDKFEKYIDELNIKYNGKVYLNESLVKKTSDIYYDPLKVLGRTDLNVYNKQKTEFTEILDNAIYDLIYSIERDKEAGIKILDISTEIIDTNKSRYKIYKVKMKNTEGGKKEVYSEEIHVPVPVKDKYIKIGGNDYIMINQFYPKPILKVKPNVVRLYTHYNTTSVTLKNHKIQETSDMKDYILEFYRILDKKTKREFQNTQEVERVLEKYNINPVRTLANQKIEIK